jgi:putative flippase GtrA
MPAFLRFLGVGGLATVTHYLAVLCLVYLLTLHPEAANVIGFLVAFSVSFFGHWRWTFREQQARFHRALPAFAIVAVSMFLLNATLFHLLLEYTSIRFEFCLLIAQSLVLVLTFLVSKYWAFSISVKSVASK